MGSPIVENNTNEENIMPIPTEPISATMNKIDRLHREADELARQATFLTVRIDDIAEHLDGLDWTTDLVREHDLIAHARTAAEDIEFTGHRLSVAMDALKEKQQQ